jgi:hypothetical protein
VRAHCAILLQNSPRIYKYQMPSLNTRHTAHTRTAMEDISCTWPCAVFATSGHTAENGSTMSVEGARSQSYGIAQGTNFSHSTWTAKQQAVQGCQVSWAKELTEHTALHGVHCKLNNVLQRTSAMHYDTV